MISSTRVSISPLNTPRRHPARAFGCARVVWNDCVRSAERPRCTSPRPVLCPPPRLR
ncbi:helix-turn-helix domain-containing protein [Streptomyces sp. NPDC056632]|uniref:helix-turn-helix domain-containing protein n=1 Tax=Streptomyces sp. NPDC056632 TaxID=3345884 RepID=UPI00369129AA